MKNRILTIAFTALSTFALRAQTIDITYADNRFVDVKGMPVTGEFNLSTANSNGNADVRISHGVLTGVAYFYYPNGNIKEIASYKDGKKDGTCYAFDEGGKLIAEANYKMNKKEGVWRIWDSDGNLRMKMHYANNSKTGTWKAWSEDGKLTGKKRF